MNYTVYKMNCLDNSSSPMDIDTFIFFSTFEERSWNIIEYLHLKRKLPKQVLVLNLNGFTSTCFALVMICKDT